MPSPRLLGEGLVFNRAPALLRFALCLGSWWLLPGGTAVQGTDFGAPFGVFPPAPYRRVLGSAGCAGRRVVSRAI
jgi:hypothetical protein